MQPKQILSLAFVSVAVFLSGCSSEDSHNHPELKTGKQLFEHHCASCHHSAGNGNFLAGVPANRGTSLSNAQIVEFMRDTHRENSKMPAFNGMPDEEATKIAGYLKSL